MAGYIYILTNQSLLGLIKIGSTLRDSKTRARELYTTGVPTPFEVAFEIFSENHEIVEKQLHDKLYEFRVNSNREFFRYPLRSAINDLTRLCEPLNNQKLDYSSESIFHQLHEKYPKWIELTIVDIRIVQTNERVWIETTKEEEMAGYLVDQTIKRTDMGFCIGDNFDNKYFSPKDTVSVNADKFINTWDPYSIINTTEIFNDAAYKEIQSDPKYNPHLENPNKTLERNI